MRKIGQQVSESELSDENNRIRGRIIDFEKRRFIQTGELYTPEGPTTLDWENLGDLERRFEMVLLPGIGGFGHLLTFLIEPLEKKGEFFRSDYGEGFYYLLESYYRGIKACGESEPDNHGRRYPTERTYYPKRLADAEGYLKYIANGGVPALMGKRVFSEK